jgi:hypothetical protein
MNGTPGVIRPSTEVVQPDPKKKPEEAQTASSKIHFILIQAMQPNSVQAFKPPFVWSLGNHVYFDGRNSRLDISSHCGSKSGKFV